MESHSHRWPRISEGSSVQSRMLSEYPFCMTQATAVAIGRHWACFMQGLSLMFGFPALAPMFGRGWFNENRTRRAHQH